MTDILQCQVHTCTTNVPFQCDLSHADARVLSSWSRKWLVLREEEDCGQTLYWTNVNDVSIRDYGVWFLTLPLGSIPHLRMWSVSNLTQSLLCIEGRHTLTSRGIRHWWPHYSSQKQHTMPAVICSQQTYHRSWLSDESCNFQNDSWSHTAWGTIPLIHHCHCSIHPNGLLTYSWVYRCSPSETGEKICHATMTKWSDDAEVMRTFQLFCLQSASVKLSLQLWDFCLSSSRPVPVGLVRFLPTKMLITLSLFCNCEISMVPWTVWSTVICSLRDPLGCPHRCTNRLSLRCGNRWYCRATSTYGNMVSTDSKLTWPSGLITAYGDIWISESRVDRIWWETVFAEQHQQMKDNTVHRVWKMSQRSLRLRAKTSSSAEDTWRNACVNTVPGHQSTSGMRTWYVVQFSSSSSLDLSFSSEFVSAPRLVSTSALMPFFSSWSNLAIPFFSRSIIFLRFLDIFLLWREFKSSWLTRIHQLHSHLCHSSPLSSYLHGMPLFHVLDSAAAAVILSYIHFVCSSSFVTRVSNLSSLHSCLLIPGGVSILHLSVFISPSLSRFACLYSCPCSLVNDHPDFIAWEFSSHNKWELFSLFMEHFCCRLMPVAVFFGSCFAALCFCCEKVRPCFVAFCFCEVVRLCFAACFFCREVVRLCLAALCLFRELLCIVSIVIVIVPLFQSFTFHFSPSDLLHYFLSLLLQLRFRLSVVSLLFSLPFLPIRFSSVLCIVLPPFRIKMKDI